MITINHTIQVGKLSLRSVVSSKKIEGICTFCVFVDVCDHLGKKVRSQKKESRLLIHFDEILILYELFMILDLSVHNCI